MVFSLGGLNHAEQDDENVIGPDSVAFCTEDQAREIVSLSKLFTVIDDKSIHKLGLDRPDAAGAGGGQKRGRCRQIKLKQANRDILRLFVDFVNGRRLRGLESLIAWPAYQFAKYYQLTSLMEACGRHLQRSEITAHNCIKLWQEFAASSRDIKQKMFAFFVANFSQIVRTNDQIFSLDVDTFHKLIIDDHLNVRSETQVWEALLNWIQWDYPTRARHLPRLLASLRYGRLSADYLKTQVLTSSAVRSSVNAQSQVERMIRDQAARQHSIGLDGHRLPALRSDIPYRPRTPNSILLLFGGWMEGSGSSITTTYEVYDLQTNRWRQMVISVAETARLLRLVYFGAECLNGTLYLIGGHDGMASALNRLTKLDLATWKTISCCPMSKERCFVTTASLNGAIYALGGRSAIAGPGDYYRWRSAEVYYPLPRDIWVPIASMCDIRSDAAAVAHGGRIYIAGGVNELGNVLNTVECYDPSRDTWTRMAPMRQARHTFSMVIHRDRMYALGGSDGREQLRSCECLDLHRARGGGGGQWTSIADMNSPRATFKAAVFDDRIVVACGFNGNESCTDVEAYDDVAKQWTPMAATNVAHSGFQLIALDNMPNIEAYTFNGE